MRQLIFAMCIFMCTLIPCALSAQCLSGNYTIGSSGSDYSTINDAIADATAKGVCGPTVFHIKTGTYVEQVQITSITGASSVNTIILQPEIGGSVVTLEYPSASNSTNNYAVYFNSANYVSLKNLKIKRTGTNVYQRVIEMSNGASNNQLYQNTISNNIFTNQGINAALVYSASSLDTANVFEENTFAAGSYGIYFQGVAGTLEPGLKISNNTFDDQNIGAIYLDYQIAPLIDRNRISRTQQSGLYTACSVRQTNGAIVVTKNNLKNFGGGSMYGSGFYFSECSTSVANPSLLANNMIKVTGTYGTSIFNGNNINIINNTFGGSTVNGIYCSVGSGIVLKNNILVGGTALYIFPSTMLSASDYNLLYAGSKIGVYGSTNCTTFQNWKTVSGKDQNSISVNPTYISASDLHIIQDVDVDASGTPTALVLDDIDGDIRDLATPDIGADEFMLPDNNIAFVRFVQPQNLQCAGYSDITIAVRNLSNNPITSLNIGWKRNGIVQPSVAWSGSLSRGETDTLIVANQLYKLDSTYAIRAWVSNPNGTTDPIRTNDSSTTLSVLTMMSGQYTIGGNSPNYTTFGAAVAALKSRGVCGPVVFKVRNGLYQEQILITSIYGASNTNTILFTSENNDSTLVRLNHHLQDLDNKYYTVKLSGAKYITFTKITISSTSYVSNSPVNLVQLENVRKIKFHNVYFKGEYSELVFSTSPGDSLEFKNNLFYMGLKGIRLSNAGKSTVITNNKFIYQTDGGLQFDNCGKFIVEKNVIESAVSSADFRGIQFTNCTDTIFIRSNRIEVSAGLYGIYSYYSKNFGEINNNIIAIGTNTESHGIFLNDSGNKNIFYNTVVVASTFSTGASINLNNSATYYRLKNNILMNTGGGLAISYSDYASFTSNYNDLYTTGLYLVNSYVNLASWKSSPLQQDLNSISANPGFVPNCHYHLALGSPVAAKGIVIATESYDIDGEMRNPTTPDIGADEFSAFSYDISLVYLSKGINSCTGHPDIYAVLKNLGSKTIYQASVTSIIDIFSTVKYDWTGELAPGETSDTLKIGTYLFAYSLNHRIKSYVRLANDNNRLNDTITTGFFTERMGGTYTVGGASPDFGTLAEAIDAVNTLGLCQSTTLKIRDGYYIAGVELIQVPGSSASNHLTIESESGDSSKVIFTNPIQYIQRSTFAFNGTDYCTLKGISFEYNQYHTFNPTIKIFNGASHINILNNFVGQHVKIEPNTNHHVTIRNNHVSYGNIILSGLESDPDSDHIIENNVVRAYNSEYGISAQNQFNLQLIGNTYVPSANIHYGILCHKVNGRVQITNNKVRSINVEHSGGTSIDPILIANNFVSNRAFPDGASLTGIRCYDNTFTAVLHNTVYSENNDAFQAAGPGKVRVENNIFYAPNGLVFDLYNESVLQSCDYNILYSTLPVLIHSPDYLTYSEWQAKNFDLHSYNLSPAFMFQRAGWDMNDLHLDGNFTATTVSNYIAEVPYDIDGKTRNSQTPVIGADELGGVLNIFAALKQGEKVLVYPNPTEGKCNIMIAEPGPINANIYNSQSQLVYTVNVDESRMLDLSKLSGGVYTLILQANGKSLSQKVVITK